MRRIHHNVNPIFGLKIAKQNRKGHSHIQITSERIWENDKLRIKTNAPIYQTLVLSTLLYASEIWTLYAGQERRLKSLGHYGLRIDMTTDTDR